MRLQLDTNLSKANQMTQSPAIPEVSVVVPVYKEERNVRPFLARLIPVLECIGTYEIVFCLDPSPDDTETVIVEEANKNSSVSLLKFSRRFGQPAATMAGILNCNGRWCVVIDVDLQDPPELIAALYARAQEGFDVVAAKRETRDGETFIKKLVSHVGYSLINKISEVPIPRNTGDFRIMSRRVVEELRFLKESHGFLRGLVALVGYRQTEILYQRDARYEGEGNYNRYLGSLKIGFNGIIGFSTFPLEFMMWGGFLIAAISGFCIFIVFFLKIWFGSQYPMGIPTVTILVLFIGGVQLASIGLLGEYVGRIYEEVRQRPRYIIERAINITPR
jgi:dolichol-phosphate mannosyltransferase